MAGSPIDQIVESLKNRNHFVLSGGAGSGKTYTLMQVLDEVFLNDHKATVACITYTNVATEEIKARSPYKNLYVSTIHEFLWNCIQPYQKNLKACILELVQNEKTIKGSGIRFDGENLDLATKTVQYKEYKKLEEGVFSHSDLLKIANLMFRRFPLICDILKDRYSFIFIDEFQDSEKQVLEIFLNFLLANNSKTNVMGLFGDPMQSIYSTGVGNVDEYINSNVLKEIKKPDNFRCSKNVIELLNKIRSDLQQSPTGKNDQGQIRFIYSDRDMKISEIKSHEVFKDWDFNDFEETKELFLTHKLIAKEKGYIDLLNAWGSSDRLVGDNKDRLAKHIEKIQKCIYFYEAKKFMEFTSLVDFKIKKLQDKKELKEKIESLKTAQEQSIDDNINLADELNLIFKDDSLKDFLVENVDLYQRVKGLSFVQVKNLFDYELGFSPYSTQHGVKGAEFDNVLVVLDNGGWNMYNFKYFFEDTAGKESIIERTRKIFYVCCSRAKRNLVVYYHNPSLAVLDKANSLFGQSNVVKI